MRTTRIICQAFFLVLFVFLAFLTSTAYLGQWPVNLFIQMDPLVGFATILSARTLYYGLIWGLAVLIMAVFLGRAWCNWVCPLGSIHHFIGYLTAPRKLPNRIIANSYRPIYSLKFYLLAALMVAALLGSLQIGWLDPICLTLRSFNLAVWPTANDAGGWIYQLAPELQFAWLVAAIFVLLLILNAFIPRFFCRVLCPLGALLGLFSRWALFRVHRDEDRCNHCGQCTAVCEGAASPEEKVRLSECTVCLRCIYACPEDALRFAAFPPARTCKAEPDLTRRRLILAGVLGAAFYPIIRTSRPAAGASYPGVVRPPGALPEKDFLAICLKCEQCVRVCPTNVIQPAFFETSLEGFWTPVLKFHNRREGQGFCQYQCKACTEVCPSGALRTISMDEKTGRGQFTGQPLRLGTAFVDRGRCLPWAMDRPCQVCEEVCPVSPKAIVVRPLAPADSLSGRGDIRLPYVKPDLCIGCGICQAKCPVTAVAAIRVQPSGESRSPASSFLLPSGRSGA